MDKSKHSAWQYFEKTGSITAYLAFKAQENRELNFEVGDDFGVNKDIRDSDKRDKIR